MTEFLPCIYAFLACVGFCIVFEVRKIKFILSASFTGFVSWFVYVLLKFIGTGTWAETVRFLIATIVVASLAEIFARILKAPAVIFLIIGILPIVPGGGIYYTMEALINGDMSQFLYQGLKTAACAGAIAVGCSLVSSCVRIAGAAKRARAEKRAA